MSGVKISVAMAAYNGAKYIRSQLESISGQTFLPVELVVFDDGSKDNTVAIIRSFAEEAVFPVRIYINNENIGSTLTFNKAISCCSGDVIVLCDQDDLWVESRLEKIKFAFEEDPKRVGVYSNASLIDENGAHLGKDLWTSLAIKPKEFSALSVGGISAFKVLLRRNVITGAAFSFRKDCVKTNPFFPKSWVHDAWIAINLSKEGGIYSIPECLVKYRQHESNQIGLNERSTSARLKIRPVVYFSDLIDAHEKLYDFLKHDGAGQDYIEVVAREIKHFRARIDGSKKRTLLFKELFNGNYSRFSSGFYSFAKDVVGSFTFR
ncbi:glycosyltransferase family 2 protein [uncultured Amphritea sp.]|uniref:glycosyltransferase family 2 protein n=1 Tax=uncultured Amphritea sp. TaxID=981605 RepID=UPI0025E48667|nr:glycosyltransferase family 2 protein [uncultured Amphritea sp.]